jgi:hypothetical protein
MADKSTRLTIRLGEDARTWLKAEADKRGLDEAAFARMLIYQHMNGAEELPVRFTLRADEAAAASRRREAVTSSTMRAPAPSHSEAAAEVFAEPSEFAEEFADDEPRAEEMDIPADADGGDPYAGVDALMQAGPSFLDDLIQRTAPRNPVAAARQAPPRAPERSYRRPMQQGLQPSYGPGSQTRAIGVNHAVAGGNIQGDGHGNVMRDNFRHFGMRGTAARG